MQIPWINGFRGKQICHSSVVRPLSAGCLKVSMKDPAGWPALVAGQQKTASAPGRSIELLKSVSWLMSGAQEFAVLLNRAHKAPESSNRRETTFQPKYINHFRQIYLV
jgi:hypothetical protein